MNRQAGPLVADLQPSVGQYMAGDVQPVIRQIVGHERRFAVPELIEGRRLLGVGPDVGELPVVPHRLDQERPVRRVPVEPVLERETLRIAGTELLDRRLSLRPGLQDASLGRFPGTPRGLGRLGGHLLIGRDLAPRDERGTARAAAGQPRRLCSGLEANDQMGRSLVLVGAVLCHQERVDPPRLAYERDIRRRVRPQGLQERDVRRAGQVPVLRVADHEIQDVLTGGEHDDRRVTDLRPQPVDPVLALLRDWHSEESVVVRLLGRCPGRERREEQRQ